MAAFPSDVRTVDDPAALQTMSILFVDHVWDAKDVLSLLQTVSYIFLTCLYTLHHFTLVLIKIMPFSMHHCAHIPGFF